MNVTISHCDYHQHTLDLTRFLTEQILAQQCALSKHNTNQESHVLLWFYWVKRSVFKEVIDVVVVDLDVRHEDAVTTVFIHVLGFTRLL